MIDHDNKIKKNFWGYVKFYIEKPKLIIPNFDKKTCFDYFVKSFKCINPLKKFQIPSWIPKFQEPQCHFDLNLLAFNMVINTCIQFIRYEKYQQLGYNFIKHMIQRHWYQFADDAAVVTGLEHEIQVLLNAFNSWSKWVDMKIRVDKCHSFRMKKVGSSSRQYKQKLYINNKLIPAIEINESFKYLGRHFDYSMSNQEHKDILCDTVDELLKDIDFLLLHMQNKFLIYHCYLLSKISCHLTIADIRMTWIKQILDN